MRAGPGTEAAPSQAGVLRVSSGFVCNNACVFCAQGRLRETSAAPGFPSLGPETAGRTVVFVGGEPTLAGDLPERIAQAVAFGAQRVVLQTNGRRLAYAGYVAALARAGGGRLWLDVSLQGSSKEMHDFHTHVPGSFAQSVAGLRNARASGLRAGIAVVVTRANYRHLAEMVQVAHLLGAEAVRAALPVWSGHASRRQASLSPPAALLAPRLEAARRAAERAGVVWLGPDAPADPRFPFAGIGETEPPPRAVASSDARRDDEGR